MNKSIVFGLLSTFAVIALVGGVAFASFSSAASNVGNTFGSGSMVLNLNTKEGSASTPVFSLSNKVPGDTADQAFTLLNTGSVPSATTVLTGITVTPTGPTNLGDKLTLDLYNDVDDSGTVTGGDTLINSAHLTSATWTNKDLGFGLIASGHHKVIARITFDAGADNTYQGDSVSFDFAFQTNQ